MQTVSVTKTLTLTVEKGEDGAPFRFIASTDSVDREGDVLVPDGMDSSEYDKNPVVLWLHDSSMPAIARAAKLYRYPNRIEVDVVFPDRPANLAKDSEWRPDEFRSLVKAGLLNALSVRARAKPGGWRDPPSVGDRSKYGDSVRRVIAKWMLEEISLVPLPMNQDAVVLALGKGLIRPETAERYLSVRVPEVVKAAPIPYRGITIRVPERGALETSEAVRLAVAKARGRIYA
jgi:hypothetical protein